MFQCRRGVRARSLPVFALSVLSVAGALPGFVLTATASAAAPVFSCAESGPASVTYHAAGLLGPRMGQLTFTGNVFGCHTSDPTIHSGIVRAGSATITLSCPLLTGTDSGRYTVDWDNGRESVITYTEHFAVPSNPIFHTVGTVVSGEFAGQSTWDYDLDIPNPLICVLGQGTVGGVWAGIGGIGIPDPGFDKAFALLAL